MREATVRTFLCQWRGKKAWPSSRNIARPKTMSCGPINPQPGPDRFRFKRSTERSPLVARDASSLGQERRKDALKGRLDDLEDRPWVDAKEDRQECERQQCRELAL